MSTAVARFVHATVQALAGGQPDVFDRSVYLVCEMDEATMNAVAQLVKLKAARATGDLTGMREAVTALVKLHSQATMMAVALGNVLAVETGDTQCRQG